jgi:iron complex outermembrane receptor protein
MFDPGEASVRHKLFYFAQAAALALMVGQTAQAAENAGGTVDEVVVTATKRDTALQRTPVAVTAVTAEVLADEHIDSLLEVTHLVPSFQATGQGDHGVITMTLRGVGNDSAKTEYADPEVALFVDSVYSPRAEGAATLLYDLSAVEVLRGPQGTLWGRNSTVGTVNLVTNKPTIGDSYGNVQVGGGSYNRFGVQGAVNVPISDKAAMRFAFAHEQHDGYVDYQDATSQLPSLAAQQAAAAAAGIPAGSFQALNPNLFVQSGPKYSAQDQSAARVSLLLAPSEALSWNLSYEYFQDRGTPAMALMQDPRPGQKFWSALIDTAPYLHREVHTVHSRIDWDINEAVDLSYIAGFSSFSGSSDFDQDQGAHVPTSFATGATFQQDRTNNSHYFSHSHEIDLRSKGDNRLDWILGLYYAAEDNSIRFDIPIFNGTQQGTVGWQGSFIQPKETVNSKAVFGQATFHVTDALRLTGGLRYTKDHRENVGGTNNAWAYNAACPQVPIDVNTDPRNSPCFTTYQFNDGEYSDDELTYLARVEADVAPGFLAYGSISSGYKSGGLQDGGVPYGPETLTNYEVGTKNTLFGGFATLNLSAFYMDFRDYQFSAPVIFASGNRGLATSNTQGKTEIYGFEGELTARPTPDDTVQVALSLLHTKLGHLFAGSNDYQNLGTLGLCDPDIQLNFGVCAQNVSGHTLPHAPELAVQFIYGHDFHFANGAMLTPRVSAHYESSSWLSIFNQGSGDKQKAYTRTDLNLRYTAAGDNPWWVEVFAQNIEDKRIRTSTGVTGDNIYTSQYLPPRTFGVNLGYKF